MSNPVFATQYNGPAPVMGVCSSGNPTSYYFSKALDGAGVGGGDNLPRAGPLYRLDSWNTTFNPVGGSNLYNKWKAPSTGTWVIDFDYSIVNQTTPQLGTYFVRVWQNSNRIANPNTIDMSGQPVSFTDAGSDEIILNNIAAGDEVEVGVYVSGVADGSNAGVEMSFAQSKAYQLLSGFAPVIIQ